MKIRTRLTLLFTTLVALLLAVFAIGIHLVYGNIRAAEFYKSMRLEASTKAGLLLDAQVAPEVLQLIYERARELTDAEEVAIYDPAFQLVYHDAVEIDVVKEDAAMIERIIREGEIRFRLPEGWHVLGFVMDHDLGRYVITAAARDRSGTARLARLRVALFIIWIAAVVVVFLLGRFFSRKALQPVAEMVKDVDRMSATNMKLRISEGDGKDELSELAHTFNRMLERLENSFEKQKRFIANISHELRTPLTAMIGELELARTRTREREELERSVDLAIGDARKLVKLSNGLLELATAEHALAKDLQDVRVDEELLEARDQVMAMGQKYRVELQADAEAEEDEPFLVSGHAQFLRLAFINVMDNACKYAPDHRCTVHVRRDGKQVVVAFSDHGPGIPQEEQEEVFGIFSRGSNAAGKQGHGIGLSLVRQIVETHHGTIRIHSGPDGTTVEISLPGLRRS